MPHTLNINANLLAAMDDLSLLARTVVEGFFDGLHRSPFLGYSTEFSAYRAYTQGDNLRHIDWKLWGRTDEFYVNLLLSPAPKSIDALVSRNIWQRKFVSSSNCFT